jgi:hypothetical protein
MTKAVICSPRSLLVERVYRLHVSLASLPCLVFTADHGRPSSTQTQPERERWKNTGRSRRQRTEDVLLLRRSKEAANKDRRERGVEFNDYLETTDLNVYNNKEDVNIDLNFTTLLPTQHHLLQAALDVRGNVDHGTSKLRVLLHPLNTSTHLCSSDLVKA